LISTNALFDPIVFGRNDTAITQFPEGAIGAPQVFVIKNSEASSPLRVMVDTSSGAEPLFLSVTRRSVLVDQAGVPENVTLVGERDRTGLGGAVPVPRRLSDLVATLPLISIVADRAPAAEGLNDTEIVQSPPGATGDPQVLVLAKSVGFAPTTVMVEI
jgi:hypothetical protein